MAWLPLGLTAQVVFCHVHGHDAQCAAETGREKRVSRGGFGGSPPPTLSPDPLVPVCWSLRPHTQL